MIFLYFCEYFMCREVKAAIQTTGASASQSIPAEFQGYEVPIHVLESLENWSWLETSGEIC